MADTSLAMASSEQQRDTIARIVELLGTIGRQISLASLAAPGSLEQTERLLFALRTISGLQQLFVAERARQSVAPATATKES